MSTKPTFTMDQTEYIDTLVEYGRPILLSFLRRCGLKQGKTYRTDRELAEIIWYATKPTRERNRANWEANHPV